MKNVHGGITLRINLYFSLLILISLTLGCNIRQDEKTINGMVLHNLTMKKGLYNLPSWSPDGEKIAFVFNYKIMILKPDGSSWVNTKIDNSGDFGPFNMIWGKPEEIIYDKLVPNKDFKDSDSICVNNLVSKEETVLITDIPPVTGLSYSNNRLLYGENDTIFMYSFTDKSTTKLNIKGYFPVWSPDGKSFAYNNDGICLYNTETTETEKIYIRKLEGAFIESKSWSPDGKWIAFRGGPSKETNGIYILPGDGSAPPIQILNMAVSKLSWSPKGDKILFTTVGSPGYNEMYIMDIPEIYKN